MKCDRVLPGTGERCAGDIAADGYCRDCGYPPSAGGQPGPVIDGSGASGAASLFDNRQAADTVATAPGKLGTGLVVLPAAPHCDPRAGIRAGLVVAESKRFCLCGAPVGRRGPDGLPGRTEGFCPACRHPFSFNPRLHPGDLVDQHYRVEGCLAHGGLGWVYLAKDRPEIDRWVVLKGLRDADDAAATAAAIAERESLAKVVHPNIVEIYDFVQHEEAGYIVMEYVDGISLGQLLTSRTKANGGRPDPLPPDEAIEFILRLLPALGYLHSLGLLYCDLKPDNIIHSPDGLKLIDLGGVYRIGAQGTAVYGTPGYQAPEIAEVGPSIASDLYAAARTLLMLCTEGRGYRAAFAFTLPDPQDVPLFRTFDSLYRFLEKATAPEPADRFQSAADMSDQLLGVQHEVVASRGSTATTFRSTLFTGELGVNPNRPNWRDLPRLNIPSEELHVGSVEADLRLGQALIDAGSWPEAETVLGAIESTSTRNWRVPWLRGVLALAHGDAGTARTSFDGVYRAVPGELAPKLALAVASELDGDLRTASNWFDIVSRTDPAFTVAAFGLARCAEALGDQRRALAALQRIPRQSSSFLAARVRWIGLVLRGDDMRPPNASDLVEAAATIDKLELEEAQRAGLVRDLLVEALDRLQQNTIDEQPELLLLGHALTVTGIRQGLERTYRALALLTPNWVEAISLVDSANTVRARTWT